MSSLGRVSFSFAVCHGSRPAPGDEGPEPVPSWPAELGPRRKKKPDMPIRATELGEADRAYVAVILLVGFCAWKGMVR